MADPKLGDHRHRSRRFDMCNISCSAILWRPESTGGCFHARYEVVKVEREIQRHPEGIEDGTPCAHIPPVVE